MIRNIGPKYRSETKNTGQIAKGNRENEKRSERKQHATARFAH